MPTTICLCFSDTGGGHRSAAEALEAALKELLEARSQAKDFVILADNVVEKTHPLNRGFVELYNFLLRHSQASMKYYFWFIHWLKPNNSALGYKLSGAYLRKLLLDAQPKVVVSIHPMTNHYLSRAIADVGMAGRVKLITLITDPNDQLWRGWGCTGSDLTIVPNQIVEDKLIEWGVAPAKIKRLGMPVHPDYMKRASATPGEFREHLGLEADCFTLCINAGWAGGGNMLEVFRALEGVTRKIQVVFLCGHNKGLYEKATREAELSPIPTAVLPFHDRMSDLMSAVDLMVTKAGGLTTFEAVARRLPLVFDVITPPMPQESGTIDILVNAKLASRLSRPQDIVEIVQATGPRGDYMDGALPSYQNLNCTNAIFDIAATILDVAASPGAVDPVPGEEASKTLKQDPTGGASDFAKRRKV